MVHFSLRQSGAVHYKDLGLTVDFEVGVSILLGLEVNAKIKTFMEVFMNNSIGLIASIWCGGSFLRGAKKAHFQPK